MIKPYHIIIALGGLLVFSFFIQESFPIKIIAIVGLLMSSIIIGIDTDLKKHVFGAIKSNSVFLICVLIGLSLGVTSAIMLRNSSQLSNYPKLFSNFVLFAVLIGMTEELIFRGWFQGVISRLSKFNGVFLVSIAHATFKTFLFISPTVKYEVELSNLFVYTFLAGIILGVLRFWSGSIWPAVIAHVLFDVIVYGDVNTWPWWVI